MTALVMLKVLSLFCHGMNFLFVSRYGHQREIWAITYYVVHLLVFIFYVIEFVKKNKFLD